MFSEKSSVSALQDEQNKRILAGLIRSPDNRSCADCCSRGATWASVNLGVLICLNCSGVHRYLGVHNSKVRSTNLDTWLPEQVAFVQSMGNILCNSFWEANLPKDFSRPRQSDIPNLRKFITNKYVNRLYCPDEYKDNPINIDNYTHHPFLAQYRQKSSPPSTKNNTSSSTTTSNTETYPRIDLLSLDDTHAQPQPPPLVPAPPVTAPDLKWDPFATTTTTSTTNTTITTSTNAAASVRSASQALQPQSHPIIVQQNSTTDIHRDPFEDIARAATSSESASVPANYIFPEASVPANYTFPEASVPAKYIFSEASSLRPQQQQQPPPLFSSVVGETSSHAKGKLSHEDILAMFDSQK